MRRLVVAIVMVVLGGLTLTGCGADSSQTASDLPTKVIEVTLTGDRTTPNGQKIEVAVGQRIELEVTADKPGEIHVHSSPQEQELEYEEGSSTLDLKPIPAPGQVTVESHTLGRVLFTLVAR